MLLTPDMGFTIYVIGLALFILGFLYYFVQKYDIKYAFKIGVSYSLIWIGLPLTIYGFLYSFVDIAQGLEFFGIGFAISVFGYELISNAIHERETGEMLRHIIDRSVKITFERKLTYYDWIWVFLAELLFAVFVILAFLHTPAVHLPLEFVTSVGICFYGVSGFVVCVIMYFHKEKSLKFNEKLCQKVIEQLEKKIADNSNP